ncbi:Gtt3 protein [Maudiozyma humilis]|uniref:Gtt3 protein n=1 Tax=Maudiozyma humilis TaxID=51915 RepID=A0AAV5RZG6_MAUHU|nr:Gtt3 protein [Kazachstania humilis]
MSSPAKDTSMSAASPADADSASSASAPAPYSFKHWKKVELVDLCNKMHLEDVPIKEKKAVLIEFLEDHLYALPGPLDTEVDFPELRSFFDHTQYSENVANHTLHDAASDEDSENASAASTTNYNKLNFSEEKAADEPFLFNLQERFTDIVDCTKQLNENVQDFFSSLITITVLFQTVEFLLIVQDYFQRDPRARGYNIAGMVAVWLGAYVGLPVLFGYYFNFIRYDLLIEIDPMMLNVAKGLLFLLLAHCKSSGYLGATSHIMDNLTSVGNGTYLCDCCVIRYLGMLTDILGNIPFVFAVAGALITLYVF